MKQKLTFLVLICLMCFSACDKGNEFRPDNLISNSVDPTEAVMNLKTESARRLAFGTLNATEKVKFVDQRLKSFISDFEIDDSGTLLLKDLRRFLKPELYAKNSKLGKEFSSYEPIWRAKAQKSITKTQLKYLFSFSTLNDFKTRIQQAQLKKTTTVGRSEIPDCDCSQSSDWCDFSDVCKWGTGCLIRQYYCGTLFLYDCDGTCRPR